jgi:hypothetical protein
LNRRADTILSLLPVSELGVVGVFVSDGDEELLRLPNGAKSMVIRGVGRLREGITKKCTHGIAVGLA